MSLKAFFHSSQKPTRKLAARTFIQSQYLKALAASLRVGFCDEWKRGFIRNPILLISMSNNYHSSHFRNAGTINAQMKDHSKISLIR